MDIRKIIETYKDVIPYLFFGVCTTLVNVIVYWGCAYPLRFNTMDSTIVAWILAVLFAYVTNRKWVFNSKARTVKEIIKEGGVFFGCRFVTGVVDWVCMFVFVQIFEWNDVFVKFASNLIVIVLNYVASKLVIFAKGDK